MLSILIFAHIPPPHHGQSYMVAQLLEELRASQDAIRVFHVDCRVSDRMEDVGRSGARKVFRMLRYCWQAISLRLRHGPMVFYYVPAPAKRGALYRDWLVMALCRPFFRGKIVFHWHAVGLGAFLAENAGVFTSRITQWLLGKADLSLVLAKSVADDAEVLRPKRVRVLPNGIPDPCPSFKTMVLPARLARARSRVLFLSHCTPEKGLYDALDAVFRAGGRSGPLTFTVAGGFPSLKDHQEFDETVARHEAVLQAEGLPPATVQYVGFAGNSAKSACFQDSDCFCFPTYYPNEVMPVALLESMAYGLPIVTTRWRAIPEMLPASGAWIVAPHEPEQVALALGEALKTEVFDVLREHFLANFKREVFGQRFLAAIKECFSDNGNV